MGVWEGSWCASTQEESEKAVWKGQNHQGWREVDDPRWEPGNRHLAIGVKGLSSPRWEAPSLALPLLGCLQRLQTGRQDTASNPQEQVWGCWMLQAGAEGISQRLVLQEEDDTAT